MAVIVKRFGICYFPVPKVANTSMKHFLYKLEHGKAFSTHKDPETGVVQHIHKVLPTPVFSDVDMSSTAGFLRFAIIRDPVERLVSAWRNRVRYHQELSEGKVNLRTLKELGLPENPDLDTFVDNLDKYRTVKASIKTHTDPIVDFLGFDASFYHLVFTMNQSDIIEKFLYSVSGVKDSIGRHQTGGPSASITDLDQIRIGKIREYYSDDYRVFGECLNSDGAGVSRY